MQALDPETQKFIDSHLNDKNVVLNIFPSVLLYRNHLKEKETTQAKIDEMVEEQPISGAIDSAAETTIVGAPIERPRFFNPDVDLKK